MKTLIVYYSRSGTTKTVAEILAKELKADLEEIIDKTNRSGIFRYLIAGMDAIKRKLTSIEPLKKDAKKYQLIIIGMPIWVGTIPPAIRTYLKDNSLENKKVALLITCGGKEEQEKKIIDEIKKITPKANIISSLTIRKKHINYAENKIKEWKKNLKF
ncbi:MAG: flavodoxin [Candidatus Nanoarchaeia archaeon]